MTDCVTCHHPIATSVYHHIDGRGPFCRGCWGRQTIGWCTVCGYEVQAWQGYHGQKYPRHFLVHKNCERNLR